MKAKIIYHQKAEIHDRYILELTIHEVGKSSRYPDGIKYSLIFFDKRTSKKILMDNHHPKGHHFHIGENEFVYSYVNDEKLIEDFYNLIFDNTGIRI